MNRFKELRKLKKITQKQLAQICNVTYQTVQTWENGTIPRVDILYKLCELYECSIDYLLDRSEIKNPEKDLKDLRAGKSQFSTPNTEEPEELTKEEIAIIRELIRNKK